jgi:hypothetical protein
MFEYFDLRCALCALEHCSILRNGPVKFEPAIAELRDLVVVTDTLQKHIRFQPDPNFLTHNERIRTAG